MSHIIVNDVCQSNEVFLFLSSLYIIKLHCTTFLRFASFVFILFTSYFDNGFPSTLRYINSTDRSLSFNSFLSVQCLTLPYLTSPFFSIPFNHLLYLTILPVIFPAVHTILTGPLSFVLLQAIGFPSKSELYPN